MLLTYLATNLMLVAAEPLVEQSTTEQCVLEWFRKGDDSVTLAQIRQQCQTTQPDLSDVHIDGRPVEKTIDLGVISERITREHRTQFQPYVITPHKMNYILPVLTTDSMNRDVYSEFSGYQDNLEDIEAKFQLSFKLPMNTESLFIDGDGLYVGFTLQAWWQIYASGISKPFRETNYQPEIFYIAPLDWHPFGGNTGFVIGLEHESNGRDQGLSRSWNRLYGHFLYEKGNFALSVKPWYRLEEKDKLTPLDPEGDDNPDIDDYMGDFELGMVYQWNEVQFGFTGRQNFSTHNGAAELRVTFPLWGELKGYATAFNGYGESLIDYNHRQTRFGLGIALNGVF